MKLPVNVNINDILRTNETVTDVDITEFFVTIKTTDEPNGIIFPAAVNVTLTGPVQTLPKNVVVGDILLWKRPVIDIHWYKIAAVLAVDLNGRYFDPTVQVAILDDLADAVLA